MDCLMAVLCGLYHFIKDFQTLIAGLVAILAAIISARPVWRQLDRMAVQTDTIVREFLADRLQSLKGRRQWLRNKINPFRNEVGQRLYEMRELENGLNIDWVFERDQLAGTLIDKLRTYQVTNRDPAAMAQGMDVLITKLEALRDSLGSIHRPHSMDQSGEDYAYTDEEWAGVKAKANAADEALDRIVSEFEAAAKSFFDVVDSEVSEMRDRVKATDDALLAGKS